MGRENTIQKKYFNNIATEGNNNLQGTEINDKIFLYNLLKRT